MPRRTDRTCTFCSQRAFGAVQATCDGSLLYGDPGARLLQRLAVCPTHFGILQAAGKAGRVHRSTGVRWWLGDRRPPAPKAW